MNYSVACPNYFRTMSIPIVKGREFQTQDILSSQGVIVVNETMAHTYWPKEDRKATKIEPMVALRWD